jgi:hypothetical protein
MPAPKLSLVVVAYNMARELPRTIRSLSPHMQSGIDEADYEVIVIDNGSTVPFDEVACRRWLPDLRVHRFAAAPPSPVEAINHGLSLATGELIGVCIDGARLASPGLLATALSAAKLHDTPVIGALGFHLGPEVQMKSIQSGYSQAREDALLDAADWTDDGYRLFCISALAGSSVNGWFLPIAESNALFLRRRHWHALGGFDARFKMPGGGLANLDIWQRACALPDAQVILLLGEGTFHQIHGGAATNAPRNMYPELHEEYVKIRGTAFQPPTVQPLFVGRVPKEALPSIAWSAEHAARQLLTRPGRDTADERQDESGSEGTSGERHSSVPPRD